MIDQFDHEVVAGLAALAGGAQLDAGEVVGAPLVAPVIHGEGRIDEGGDDERARAGEAARGQVRVVAQLLRGGRDLVARDRPHVGLVVHHP